MNNLVLTLVGACAVGGMLRVRWGRLLFSAVLTVVLGAVIIGGLRLFFGTMLDNAYRKDEIIAGCSCCVRRCRPRCTRRLRLQPPPSQGVPAWSGFAPGGLSAWDTCRTICRLPISMLPAPLVGFDVEMAHTLARDLGVELEFVPIVREQMVEQVNTGYCDLMMSGVPVTPEWAQAMTFSAPYLKLTVAFVVKDHRREEFSSREAVRRLTAPRIGVPNLPYYIDKVRRYLPQAEIVVLKSAKEFFETRGEELDAFVYSAEAGSAWTLLYPAYSVAIPQPDILAAPLAYPMARGDRIWPTFSPSGSS